MNRYRLILKILSLFPRTRTLARVAAKLAIATGLPNMAQLRRNLGVFGEDDAAGALEKYYYYFSQLGPLENYSPTQIRAQVIPKIPYSFYTHLQDGPVVCAMAHCGNWDLAAYWANLELAPVTTVAEVVQPTALFEEFVRLRNQANMTIIPATKGAFQRLKASLGSSPQVVPLLADRDITGSGIEVDLGGQRALVAAGPAALANDLHRPLYVIYMKEVPLGKARASLAGTTVGYQLEVRGPIPTGSVPEQTRVWAQVLSEMIGESPTDWHMLQPVFVDDLDPQRLARARKRAGT